MGLIFAAELGEEVEVVGSGVAVVEVEVHALRDSGIALAEELAGHAHNAVHAAGIASEGMHETHADLSGVGLRRAEALVVKG